jgi:two-component system chemotaxis sensor kinase CheA
LGFGTLESVTHVGENLLSKLRDGDLVVTTEITSGLLAMVDAVREILGSVAATGGEGDLDYPHLVAHLDLLHRGEVPAPAAPLRSIRGGNAPAKRSRKATNRTIPVVTVTPGKDDSGLLIDNEVLADQPVDEDNMFGVQLLSAGKITEEQLAIALQRQDEGDTRRVGEILVEEQAISPQEVTETLKAQGEERAVVNETIRVDVSLLDDLMNLVGELVLARNQILQFTQNQGDPSFNATSQRLNLITTELQAGVMKTRMQPIENVWNKFPRVVRDLTISCGKRARLEMDGKHTELDKTLLEAIKDPLTHLVRNAVDHGLESPEVRRATGKADEGVVRLGAYHEGGQVIIEISDDGAGIDAAKLRRKAVQKGLMTAEEAAGRSDRDMLNVIFMAGFSTADAVSNISGRGVGMDVVKTNIEGIGGSVDVQTVLGKGTTFKVKIPLTLAIIPALVVTVGGDRYAIPQVSLLELVRLDVLHGQTGQNGQAGIEWIQGVPVYRLRGRLLPLVFLDEVFDNAAFSGSADRTGQLAEREAYNIVVVQADDHQFGLVVDEISDTAEIVVKPLGRLLKHVDAFAGATIMGDGRVALILDVGSLVRRSRH